MNLEHWLVDPQMLLILLNAAIAASLACAGGLAAVRLSQALPLRHAILLISLVLVFLSPVAHWAATASGLCWLKLELHDNSSLGSGASQHVAPVADNDRSADRPLTDGDQPFRPGLGRAATKPESKIVVEERTSRESRASIAGIEGDLRSPRGVERSPSADARRVPVPWWRCLGSLAATIWIVGSVVGVARLAKGYLVVLKLRRSLRPASVAVSRMARRCALLVNLQSRPEVFATGFAPVPLTVGLWRPVVVVPWGIERQLTFEQLEGVLSHELAHIARRDQWIGLLQRVTELLFWWQPLVYRVGARLSSVREDLCDNFVLRLHGNGLAYAQALVELAARVAFRNPLPATVGLMEEIEGLEGRVERLLSDARNDETRLSRRATVAVGAFGLMLTTILVAATFRVARASQDETDGRASATNEVRVRDSNELVRATQGARPGTTILLEPGTYRGGLTLNDLRGTAERPIVIAAADPENRPVIEGGKTCLHFSDPAFIELRNLVLQASQANGLNIDDGGSYDSPAHHVLLQGLTVRDVGSDRNHDGIKLSGLDDFRIENCTVKHWGKRGSAIDMVGCHRGVITGSTFREGDPIDANAVQMKGGSSDIAVRNCRFDNAGGRAINIGGSTGLEYFRPKAPGYEAKDIAVEDCTFVGSMVPVAFVGVDGAVVRYNTIYRPARWVLRILQENRGPDLAPCRNGRFANNVVVFRSDEASTTVNVGPGTSPETFSFADNHWYCLDRPEKSGRLSLPVEETRGVYGTDPLFENEAEGDLRLKDATPVRNAGPRTM